MRKQLSKTQWLKLGGFANPYLFRKDYGEGWIHFALMPDAVEYAKTIPQHCT